MSDTLAYSGGMVVVAIVLAAVQPLCTRGHFQEAMGPVLDDDRQLVAESVFSDYLERAGSLEDEDGQRAAVMLAEFIASLHALASEVAWTQACRSLHTTVLLEERESNNPWPGCPWIDPSLLEPPAQVSSQMYTFLTEEADRDRRDRGAQRTASAANDLDACRSYTSAAMERWSQWQDLLDHLMRSATPPLTAAEQLAYRTAAYPGLVLDPQPPLAAQWIMEHVEDPDVQRAAKTALSRWQSALAAHHEREIEDIRTARLKYGFDPWSPGCGTPTSSAAITLRNKLLATSAKTTLLAREAMSRLESVLSKKDRTALREYLDHAPE